MSNSKEHVVFVYGTLKSDQALNDSMVRAGGKFVADARIDDKLFVMRNLGHYPALQLVQDGAGTPIRGELWLVPDEGMQVLDMVEGVSRGFYKRDRFSVMSGSTKYTSWVYFMDDPASLAGLPVIDSGEWDMGPVSLKCPPKEERTVKPKPAPKMGFTAQQGIFITTDWGEHYGPFESISQAVEAAQGMQGYIDDGGVKTLTIGVRFIRDDLSQNDIQELNYNTIEV